MTKNIRQEEKNTKNSMTPQIIQDIIYNWVNENYGSEEAENRCCQDPEEARPPEGSVHQRADQPGRVPGRP